MDATGSEHPFLLIFFFFKQTQERATCLHFCVQPERRASPALGTDVGLELDWPRRAVAARGAGPEPGCEVDCLKTSPSWPSGQWGHLAGAPGHRDRLQQCQVGWGLRLWEGRARSWGPGGSAGLFCVESIFNVLII